MRNVIKALFVVFGFTFMLDFMWAKPHEGAKDFQEIVVDCDRCVIDMGLTIDEIDGFKKEMDEDDFYTLADDVNYYAYTLREYLEANGIELQYIAREKLPRIRLVFPNESVEITKLERLYEYYLYQKNKKPYKLKDIVTPENEINAYFTIANPKYPKENEGIEAELKE